MRTTRARRGSPRIQPISEINMTPLIDMSFLLLITFVITFPLVEVGIPVNLPKGARTELTAARKRTITLDLRGNLFLDNAPVTHAQLNTAMAELGRRDPATTILVRADEGIAYGRVVAVMKILNEAKLTRLALVTRTDDGRRP